MTAHPTTEDLIRLQQEVAALRAGHAAQQARLAHLERAQRRRPRRHFAFALVALLVALLPLSLLAASFTDLPNPDEGHNADINAIADAGITHGCNPPANDQFCPHDLVTRQDMASFLARLGGLGGNPPVANALSAQTATNAQNAATVGGFTPGQLTHLARDDNGYNPIASSPPNQPFVTTTITAPANGYVLAVGVAMFYINGTGCLCSVQLNILEPGHPETGASNNYSADLFPTGTDPGAINAHTQIAATGVFPITAGPHTFAMVASRYRGTATIQGAGTLNLLFSPTAETDSHGVETGGGRP
jgi:hypothetical protein